MQATTAAAQPTDRDILGYSRWIVFVAAFLAMAVISPYEYAWSSMSGHIGGLYHWSHTQVGWLFTLFVVFEAVGTLRRHLALSGVVTAGCGRHWEVIRKIYARRVQPRVPRCATSKANMGHQ